MDNLNVTMLNDQFNMYYAAAKRAYEAGNGALAKRSYMLAADTLLKLAKVSSPKLKQARLERAKRLLQIADGIGAAVERKTIPAGSDDDEEQGTHLFSRDTYFLCTPKRDREYEEVFADRHDLNGRRIKATMYVRKYVD